MSVIVVSSDNKVGCCDDTNVKHRLALRVTGVILFITSIIEFGLGGSVYSTLSDIQLGAWWTGVLALVAAVLSIIAANKGLVVAAIVVASFATIIGIVGSSVDGIAATIINSLVSCGGPSGYFGIQDGQELIKNGCYGSDSMTANECYCVDQTDIDRSLTDDDLWDTLSCYKYTLANSADTCDVMLNAYPRTLSASCAFCVFVTVLCFCISIIGCAEQCCNKDISSVVVTSSDTTTKS